MKIHNYGNDYAFQQKQKSVENEKSNVHKMQVQEPKEVADAGNQVQEGGERPMEESGEEILGAMGEVDGTKEEVHLGEEEKPTSCNKKKKIQQN